MGGKVSVEIERLLRWAYQDELSKRFTSSAEGIWNDIEESGWLGGISPDKGSPQRYDFGEPDPDAERVEAAVGALQDEIFDWEASRDAIMGDLAALLVTRDVLMVRPFKVKALVTMHAVMGTRPDWREEQPRPWMVVPDKGPKDKAKVVGECRARDHYTQGSYCPLKWSPSPLSIAIARLEYVAWHRGLCLLADRLGLDRHEALAPTAPALPWLEERAAPCKVFAVGERGRQLPLKPQRALTGAARPRRPVYPVRHIALDKGAKA